MHTSKGWGLFTPNWTEQPTTASARVFCHSDTMAEGINITFLTLHVSILFWEVGKAFVFMVQLYQFFSKSVRSNDGSSDMLYCVYHCYFSICERRSARFDLLFPSSRNWNPHVLRGILQHILPATQAGHVCHTWLLSRSHGELGSHHLQVSTRSIEYYIDPISIIKEILQT